MDAAIPSRVAGLDWASRLHAVCVLDPDGHDLEFVQKLA